MNARSLLLRYERSLLLRRTQLAAFGLLVLLCAGNSAAQIPAKPIRIVVPYAAGGQPDVAARIIGQKVSEAIGQPVLAENRPGAGGVLAVETLLRAPADGTTLLVADSSIYSINPVLNRKLPFDPLKDLAPVTLSTYAPIFLVVNPSLGVGTLRDFLAVARARPGLAYGSSGPGTGHHLAMELIRVMGGLQMTHVPYKGAAQSVPAVVAGDVPAAFAGLASISAHAKAGKLKVLAVATPARSSIYPEAPTVSEAGLPGYEVTISIGFLAAAGTPRTVVEALSAAFNKVLKLDGMPERLAALGLETHGSTPQQYSDAIRAEIAQYADLVQKAALKPD
jgi:tripartite-type tricarboxylate transporter receptor subunit TctC